jgi:2-polyprenyl-6-methoxyphenol hydroxylase-like FAD-dependent oxidoreductase
MYDAVVVGARCAGSPTAMLLARKGYRVLLVDKATFPSDTMSTLLVFPNGMDCLERWGLADRVRESGCPSMRSWLMSFGELSLTGFPWSPQGVTETLAPRRTVLDKILVDAAAVAGAEVREGLVFEGVLWEGDVVAGIRARSKVGGSCEEKARIVIGADGMRSPFAAAVGAEKVVDRPALTCAYYSFYSGMESTCVEMHIGDGRSVIVIPTHDGNTLVAVQWRLERFHEVRSDIEGNHRRAVDAVAPRLGERMRDAKREERFTGTADPQNFFRRSSGPGWALVGDAAYHKDPITAQGISDAFRYAELLVESIDEGLSGRRPLPEALADYERRRNESAMPIFEFACRTGELRPTTGKARALLEALRSNPEATSRMMGLTAGTVVSADFFQPENLARIMGGASSNSSSR